MTFELHPDLHRDGIAIGQFPLCQVLLINDSAYPWFVLVPRKQDIRDTIDLEPDDYTQLWEESRIFSRGIIQAFEGDKLNVASLGNMTPQLHIHHIVRFKHDAAWPGPIWGHQALTPYSDSGITDIRNKISNLSLEQFRA